MATRSSPIRDQNRDVIGRSVTQARGLGDITFTVRRWMFDPEKHSRGNTWLGLGVKLPTGENNVVDTRRSCPANAPELCTLSNGTLVNTVQTVDQSIQPGDGGFGVIVDLLTYYRFAHDRLGAYFTGTYLINAEGTSGVPTYRGAEGEQIMSIADQYLARAGLAWYAGKGWALSAGYRIEGVPVHDLFGSSDGFRRPGYAVSVEPGVAWTHGPHTVALYVPIATVRDRKRSLADQMNATPTDDVHGDAAFADYLILVGYLRKF
jgi:hypothetical protein